MKLIMIDYSAYVASVWAILVVFGSVEGCWVVMLDCKAYLASVSAILAVLGSMGGCWMVMLDCRECLASVWVIWVELEGLRFGVAVGLSLTVGHIWPLCRQFGRFQGVRGSPAVRLDGKVYLASV